MISFTYLLEATYKNQNLLSKRGEAEKRALHSQFRQLNKTDDVAANSNPKPLSQEDIDNLDKWIKFRSKDTAFKGVVDQGKYQSALMKQKLAKKEKLNEFVKTKEPNNKNEYKLYDWGDNQVYNEAGTFTTAQLAFMKLNQLYKKDPDAYGDLGVIKYEGNDVYHITQKGNKFYKSKM